VASLVLALLLRGCGVIAW